MDRPVALYVSNVPYEANAANLTAILDAYLRDVGGAVRELTIRTEFRAGKHVSTGQSFVTVDSGIAADKLFYLSREGMLRYNHRNLKVQWSKRKVNFQPTYNPDVVENLILQVGNLVGENQLKPLWQANDFEVTLEVTFESRTLSVKLKPLLNGTINNREYKLEFKFRDIIAEAAAPFVGQINNAFVSFNVTDIRRPRAILLRPVYPPHVYGRAIQSSNNSNNSDNSDDSDFFELNSQSTFEALISDFFNYYASSTEAPWVRGTDFTTGHVIGRSFYYLLTLSPESYLGETIALSGVLNKLISYGLVEDPAIPRSLQVLSPHISGPIPPFELVQQAGLCTEFSNVPYCILIKILQLISDGRFCGLNLPLDFVTYLCQFPREVVLAALKTIQDDEEGAQIFEPVRVLHEKIERLPSPNFYRSQPSLNLDSQDSMFIHRVLVTPTTVHCLGPEIDSSNRVTRHYSHLTEDFLRVSFVDEHLGDLPPQALTVASKNRGSAELEQRSDVYIRVLDLLATGMQIGSKHFQFLAFSTSQLREQSVWMFSPAGDVTSESIRKWMGSFLDIRNVAKCAARMGQCFSSSRRTLDVPPSDRTTIPDIEVLYPKKYIFSDGIGTVTPEFASEVWAAMSMKGCPASAFQIRYAGAKGVVAVHPLSPKKLCLRKSMQKFTSDHLGFEVLEWTRFRPGYLNRQIITLLSTLGVMPPVLMSLQDVMVRELNLMLEDPREAIRILEAFDSSDFHKSAVDMLMAGFVPRQEPHLNAILKAFRAVKLMQLKSKARIFVPKSRCLMGCLDEFGDLEYGEVFLQVTRSPKADYRWNDGLDWPRVPNSSRHNPTCVVVGRVVVAKCPCLHPGDVRVLNAVDIPRLHHMVDCLVFPQKGHRPHPNECSGSDLDGDLYFVSWDKGLIPPANASPMDYEPPGTVELDRPVDIKVGLEGGEEKEGERERSLPMYGSRPLDIAKFFADYMTNNTLGIIANAHVVHADQSNLRANDPKCIELAKLFSTAVDFPKTGLPAIMPMNLRPTKYPDFMEKEGKDTYVSSNILGRLYREAKTAAGKESDLKVRSNDVEYDPDLEVRGFMDHVEDAKVWKGWYDQSIVGLMNQYGIKTEAELVTGHILAFNRYNQKRQGEVKDRVRRAVTIIRKQVRSHFDGGKKAVNTRFLWPKASACYYVAYAEQEISESGKERLLSFPWILADVLSDIKKEVSQARRKLLFQMANLKVA